MYVSLNAVFYLYLMNKRGFSGIKKVAWTLLGLTSLTILVYNMTLVTLDYASSPVNDAFQIKVHVLYFLVHDMHMYMSVTFCTELFTPVFCCPV